MNTLSYLKRPLHKILGLFLVACFALKVHNVLLCDAMYQHSQQFSSRLYLVFIQLISPFINHIATNTKIASKACDTNIRKDLKLSQMEVEILKKVW
jgi:hypothetical protein